MPIARGSHAREKRETTFGSVGVEGREMGDYEVEEMGMPLVCIAAKAGVVM
jgi:hypothetical protein